MNLSKLDTDAQFLAECLPTMKQPLIGLRTAERILFAPGPGLGLGDQCMCAPLVEALRQRFPGAVVTVLSDYPDFWQPISSEHVTVESPSEAGQIVQRIAHFDLSILGYYIGNLAKLAQSENHIVFAAGGELMKYRCFHAVDAKCHEVPLTTCRLAVTEEQKFLGLFHDLGISPGLDTDFTYGGPTQTPHMISGSKPCVLLHPCAAKTYKEWPVARWIQLAEDLVNDGISVSVSAGSNTREHAVAHSIREAAPSANVLQQTSLPDFIDALGRFDLVISGDTGIPHLAAHHNLPCSLSVFGPTDPIRFCPGSSNCFFISPFSITRDAARNSVHACLSLITHAHENLAVPRQTGALIRAATRFHEMIIELERWNNLLLATREFNLLAREFASVIKSEYHAVMLGGPLQQARIKDILEARHLCVILQYLRQSSAFRAAQWIAAYE